MTTITATSHNPNLKQCECVEGEHHKSYGTEYNCSTMVNKKYKYCYTCLDHQKPQFTKEDKDFMDRDQNMRLL